MLPDHPSEPIRPLPVLAHGVIVGFVAALVGVLIGFVVGIGNLGVIGGGIVGFLVTLAVVAIYVFSSGRSGQYGHFLRESGVLFVVLALPTILTGIITALLKNALKRPRSDGWVGSWTRRNRRPGCDSWKKPLPSSRMASRSG